MDNILILLNQAPKKCKEVIINFEILPAYHLTSRNKN